MIYPTLTTIECTKIKAMAMAAHSDLPNLRHIDSFSNKSCSSLFRLSFFLSLIELRQPPLEDSQNTVRLVVITCV